MSASTNMLSDAKAIVTAGPAAATTAKAINPAGPIMDYVGNTQLCVTKVQETDNLLLRILSVTDGSDPNKTNLTAVQHELTGGSAPSGTVITAMKAVYAQASTAATSALAIAAAGPIMDYMGMVKGVIRVLEELFTLYTSIKTDTDAGDSNLTTINNILTALT